MHPGSWSSGARTTRRSTKRRAASAWTPRRSRTPSRISPDCCPLTTRPRRSGRSGAFRRTPGVPRLVAPAISVYVWAIGVLIAIMDLMTADDGMSPELAKTLYSIKSQLQGLEQIQRADSMIAMHAEFDGRIDRGPGLLLRP